MKTQKSQKKTSYFLSDLFQDRSQKEISRRYKEFGITCKI
jgi:hypothetical protein